MPIHLVLGWASVLYTLWLIGFHVPSADKLIGESYLIFFFHFPSAVNCLNFFIIAGVLSLLYLVRRKPSFDLLAASCVEVGVLACSVTLLTGSIWARAAWGVFWDARDPRLMTVAIMWLTYVGYWALRSTIDEPEKRSRFCGVFGTIAALNVPVVYFAIQWFGQSHHPMQVDLKGPEMVYTRWIGAASFFVLYTSLWRLRYSVHSSRSRENSLEAAFARAGI